MPLSATNLTIAKQDCIKIHVIQGLISGPDNWPSYLSYSKCQVTHQAGNAGLQTAAATIPASTQIKDHDLTLAINFKYCTGLFKFCAIFFKFCAKVNLFKFKVKVQVNLTLKGVSDHHIFSSTRTS